MHGLIAGILALIAVTPSLAAECAIDPPSADGTVSMARPVAGSVLREFGNQFDDIANTKTNHAGVDFEAPEGEPIFAARGGKVVEADTKGELGLYLRIDDGNGLETAYGHLASIAPAVGACVRPGEQIGTAGATGKVLGPRLHFEVVNGGEPVDPLPYLQ